MVNLGKYINIFRYLIIPYWLIFKYRTHATKVTTLDDMTKYFGEKIPKLESVLLWNPHLPIDYQILIKTTTKNNGTQGSIGKHWCPAWCNSNKQKRMRPTSRRILLSWFWCQYSDNLSWMNLRFYNSFTSDLMNQFTHHSSKHQQAG